MITPPKKKGKKVRTCLKKYTQDSISQSCCNVLFLIFISVHISSFEFQYSTQNVGGLKLMFHGSCGSNEYGI